MGRLTRKRLEQLWERATGWPADNALGKGVLDHLEAGTEPGDTLSLIGGVASVIEDIRAFKLAIEEV